MFFSRNFFVPSGLLGSVLGIGFYSFQLERMKNQGFIVRPPGAVPEDRFLGTCMKCGQCAENCPYRAIRIAGGKKGVAIGTPYLILRDIPCYLCPDLPCIKACPSGALDPRVTDPKQVRMGLAVLIDREACIALQGLRCEVCYRACPLIGEAISLEIKKNKTSYHSIFEPVIHKDSCVGCGKCEHVCILEVPAMKILSRAEVLG